MGLQTQLCSNPWISARCRELNAVSAAARASRCGTPAGTLNIISPCTHPCSRQPSLKQHTTHQPQHRIHRKASQLQATNTAAAEHSVHLRLAEAVEACRSFQQLQKVLGDSSSTNPSIAVTALLQLANLWLQNDDDDDNEAMAYYALKAQLIEHISQHLPQLPTDTQVAVVLALTQLNCWDDGPEVAEIYTAVKDHLIANFDSTCRTEMIATNLLFTALAYNEAAAYYVDLFDFLAAQTIRHASRFKLGALVQIVGAFAQMRHYNEELLDTVSRVLLPALAPGGAAMAGGPQELTAEELALLAYGFAMFDEPAGELYAAVQQAAALRPSKEWTPTAAWLMNAACLLAPDGPSMNLAVGQALLAARQRYRQEEFVMAPSLGLHADDYMKQAREELGNHPDVEEHLQQQGATIPADVRLALAALGLHSTKLQTAGEGFFVVHIGTSYKGRDVAVQVFDDASFCNTPPWRFKGVVVNELRCLEQLGYAVVTIPRFEWERVDPEPAARAKYLATKLDEACGLQS